MHKKLGPVSVIRSRKSRMLNTWFSIGAVRWGDKLVGISIGGPNNYYVVYRNNVKGVQL